MPQKKMDNYYYYYHCASSCGTRFKAETVNEAFIKQLRHLSPKEGMVDVFIEAFIKDFNNKTALLKNADGEMADDDFQEVKKLIKGKIEDLETKLNDLAVVGTEIKDLLASALKKGRKHLVATSDCKFYQARSNRIINKNKIPLT